MFSFLEKQKGLRNKSSFLSDMVKHELRVTSYKLRVTSYELKA